MHYEPFIIIEVSKFRIFYENVAKALKVNTV